MSHLNGLGNEKAEKLRRVDRVGRERALTSRSTLLMTYSAVEKSLLDLELLSE